MSSKEQRGGYLYGWGMAKNGCLPVSRTAIDKSGDCCFPARIQFDKGVASKTTKFITISADIGIFAAIDTENNLYGWGTERSFLGCVPTRLLDGVVDVEVGDDFIVALRIDNIAYVSGNSPLVIEDALTSASATSISKERWYAVLDVPNVIQVAACNSTAILLTIEGTVYSVGDSLTNGIGAPTKIFQRVEMPLVSFVALGSCHGAAIGIGSEGLFVWGEGYSGCLGIGRRIAYVPTPVECTFFRENGMLLQSVACTRGQPHPKRIMKPYSAGQEGSRTQVVTVDGTLWISGTAHKGLACDHLYKVMNPQRDHYVFYRVGSQAADILSNVRAMTGAAEDIATLPSNSAARMGMNDSVLFGLEGNTNYLSNCRIVRSCAAHIHSLALSASGELFSWGCGSDGRTGLAAYMRGPRGSKRTLKCYVSSPSHVESLEGHKVLYAAVGRYWSFAIVAEELLN